MLRSCLTSLKLSADVVACAVALSSASCGSAVDSGAVDVASIVLTPEALALTPGTARAISATVLDPIGATLPNVGIHWSVENPLIASVNAQGVVTALAAGKTQVAASKGGTSALASVTVSALPPALVRVSPTTSQLFVGGTVTLSAEVRDAGGGIMTEHTVTWASAAPTVASVNQRGIVRGLLPGNAVITATGAGLQGSAVVTVSLVPVASVTVAPATGTVLVGATLQLTASLLDASGRPLTGRTVTWSSADQNTATVSASGLVRGRAKGATTITTTSEGKAATVSITVP